ncbi:MAG: sugar nucleotide-binding protein [Motiliproteus sp.]
MFELPSILIAGAQGQLGYELEALAREEGFSVTALDSEQLDILDRAAVRTAIDQYRPDFVVNAATVIQAKEETSAGYTVNSRGAAILAECCADAACALVHVSCAEVFSDRSAGPYTEETETGPISTYAKSKLRGEELVRLALPQHVIIRTGWLFSARGSSFVRELLEQARDQVEIEVAEGLLGAPTSAADLARVILAMMKQLHSGAPCWGTYHYSAAESISWFGFAEAIVAAARQYEDIALERLIAVSQSRLSMRPRPGNSRLDCDKILANFGIHQRTWRSGLMQVVRSYYSWTA